MQARLSIGWVRFITVCILGTVSFVGLRAQESNCGNGIDDDNDGLIDCLDPDCNGASVPLLSTFNTGTNGNGGVLPSGSADAGWQISVSGMAGPYVPCTVLGAPATNPYVVSPWPDAQWVSGNTSASDNGAAMGNWNGIQGYIYHYRFQFALPCTDSCFGNVPDNYCLVMDFFADNCVMDILVNGVSQPPVPNINMPNPGSFTGFHAGNSATITLCDNWQPGLNTLTVVTLSGGGLQGFLAQVNPSFTPTVPPNQSITTAADTVCLGSSLQLAANPAGGTWAASCGTCVSNTGLFTPTATGDYYITYARPNMPNCSKDTVWMHVATPPVVQAGADDTLCSGQSVTLTGSGADTYTWDHSVLNGVAFAPTVSTTYTVIGTTTEGCSDTDQVTLTIYPAGVPINSPGDTLCLQSAALPLTAALAGGVWHSSCVACIDTSTGVFTPLSVGNHYVTYTHPNFANCGIDSVWMNVVALPTVQAGNDQGICTGTAVTLSGSGADTYTWDQSVANGVAFSPVQTQTYTVIGTDGNGCTDTDQVTITVYPVYAADVNAQICQNATYTYLGNTYQQPGNYTLSFQSINGCDSSVILHLSHLPQPEAGFFMPQEISLTQPTVNVTDASDLANTWDYYVNGVWTAGTPDFAFTFTQEGTYPVTQVVWNNTCVDSLTQLVNVIRTPEVFIPNSFTPNRDGYNNEWKPILTYIEEYTLTIFSRWGERMFETDDLYQGWNGGWFNDPQKPVELGIYVYRINYKEYKGDRKEIIGHITLLR